MSFTYREIEPGIAYEYAVIHDGRRIGTARHEEARTHPYQHTGRWIAACGEVVRSGFASREKASEFLQSLEHWK